MTAKTVPEKTSHLQWGRTAVETIKKSSFASEEDFSEYVQNAKNYPGGCTRHESFAPGIYKCTHRTVGGVACEHMTKVVVNQRAGTAEVYATGKHTTATALFDVKNEMSASEMAQGVGPFSSLSTGEQELVVSELINKSCDPSSKFAAGAVGLLSAFVMQGGIATSHGKTIMEFVHKEIAAVAGSPVDATNATDNTVGALNILYSLLVNCQYLVEPIAVSLLAPLIALQADRNAHARNLAGGCATELFTFLCPYTFFSVYPTLAAALGGVPGTYATIDWKIKVATLSLLTAFATDTSTTSEAAEIEAAATNHSKPSNVHATREQAILQLSSLLPQIVPLVTECMVDSKRQVSIAGVEAMHACCKAITNDDIRHLVPQLVNVIAKPEEAPATLNALMETTFVSNVDAPTLSLLSPLLVKTFKGRTSSLKRKAGKVIINMCKLGQEASDVLLLVTTLLPVLDKAIDEIVEFEVREVLTEARTVMLLKAVGQINHAGESTNTAISSADAAASEEMRKAMDAIAKQAKETALATKNNQNMEVPINKTLLAALEKYIYSALIAVADSYKSGADAESAATAAELTKLSIAAKDEGQSVFIPGAGLLPAAKAAVLTKPMESVLESVRRYVATACALFVLGTQSAASAVAAAAAATIAGSPSAAELDALCAKMCAASSLSDWNRCLSPYIRECMGFDASGEDGGVPSHVFNAASASAHEATVASAAASAAAAAAGSSAASSASPMAVKYRSRSNTASRLSQHNARSRANSTISNQFGPSDHALCLKMRAVALNGEKDSSLAENSEDGDLCDIEFSLAFGGKILLHNTYLRLGRGRRYGLMGKNGAGKTTLLNNMADGHIEGLPETLRTAYVQHDNASDDFGVNMVDEMMNSPEIQELTSEPEGTEFYITRQDAVDAFKEVGFTEEMLTSPRSSLSGGWKMKLLIIKAMLSKPDVLLLDEPTNHLDAASVQWLVDYLLAKKNLTVLVVSHDTGFLDNIITDVIHYETMKLVYYKGNLSAFVEKKPEAKYYYELDGDTLSFKFPLPERLDGVNSASKGVLQLRNASFTYPGNTSPTIIEANVKISLSSRVAVIGPNGAGKSTLIKMIVQETEPDPVEEGAFSEVYKHHNVRVAYVAQHSFHHVEQALDMSPVDYMKRRFHGGVDSEDFSRQNMKLTEEEIGEQKERQYGEVEQILGRRKNGRTMEYECTFVGQTKRDPNKYIAREKLEAMGLIKLINAADTKIAAAAAGLAIRPLITAEIQGHLNDFALDAEFGTHGTIRRLSGGQKVKLVLAAAMWNRPHVLILDEPTNYLDRQALGALTQAIKGFSGGVVIISHNSEFTDAVCNETWLVKENRVFTQLAAAAVEITDDMTEEERTAAEAQKEAQDKEALKQSRKDQKLKDGIQTKREKKEKLGKASTDGGNIGCTNKTIVSKELLNPKTLEVLSKKETRKLERLAAVAGESLEEYVGKIKFGSPEWNWL